MNKSCLTLLSLLLVLGAAPAPAAGPLQEDASAASGESALRRSLHAISVPDVRLLRADGQTVRFAAEVDDGRPVVLAFVFTSCTAICPAISQTLAQLQGLTRDTPAAPHIVSVSIDPDQDTPARLREYAAQFHAGPGWQHYTGSPGAIAAVQRAFGVYQGDKMNHDAVYFLRAAPGRQWVRVDGFATARQLAGEQAQQLAGMR